MVRLEELGTVEETLRVRQSPGRLSLMRATRGRRACRRVFVVRRRVVQASLVSRRGLASLTSLGQSSDSPFQPTGKKSTFYSLRTSTRFLKLQNLNPPKRKTAAHLSRERDSEVGAPQPEPRPR